MAKLLRVGRQTYDLGAPVVVEGLFATITYRLEPGGRGTRFPLIMNRLYAGRLDSVQASAASRELEEIEAGLATLPAGRAVWSLTDLRRVDDRALPVNHSAANARDYFVGADGRPLLGSLRAAILASRESREAVELASSEARAKSRAAVGLLVFGFLWTVVGYVFFPNWVLTSMYDHSDKVSGPLLWPAGFLLMGGGVFGLLTSRFPALGEWFNRKAWLAVSLLLLVVVLYLWLASR